MTLSQRITAVNKNKKNKLDSSRPNTRIFAINKAAQIENENEFTGLSNWSRQNVIGKESN